MDIVDRTSGVFERLGRPDVLIHLAWNGLPNYGSLHHFEEELPKQYNFLKVLIDEGLSSLFVAGTCFEYGMQVGSLREDLVTNPNNPYGYAKDALRKQLQYLKQAKSFNLTWARLFYMFGEGQSGMSLYRQLQGSVAQGHKTFNMSGGEQLRDYLAVEEVARRIVIFALSGLDNGVVNVCSGQPVSVKNLVRGWVDENHWNIALNLGFYDYPDYEPMEFWGDPTLQNLLLERK
jgi:nucleoside-diphosphate-sugar epimerase